MNILDKLRSAKRARINHVFRIGLGILFFISFLSWLPQTLNLYGSNGVLPVASFVEGHPLLHIEQFPTLHLFVNTDAAIILLLLIGIILSVLFVIGKAPRLSLVGMLIIHLSMIVSGRNLFQLQADWLLLEAGFLALFLPITKKREAEEPSWIIVMMYWWLLFRIIFETGLRALMKQSWLQLSAMPAFYQQTPAPSFFGWLLYHAPQLFHTVLILVLTFVLVLVPFLIFVNQKTRKLALPVFVALAIYILLVMNEGLLAFIMLLLSIWLLDDSTKWLPKLSVKPANKTRVALSILALLIIPLSILSFIADDQRFFISTYDVLKSRDHLTAVIDVSDDGGNWTERFTTKMDSPPGWTPLYADRFSYQLASADQYIGTEYLNGIARVACMNHTFVRVDFYTYNFTDIPTMIKTGDWWTRDLEGSSDATRC